LETINLALIKLLTYLGKLPAYAAGSTQLTWGVALDAASKALDIVTTHWMSFLLRVGWKTVKFVGVCAGNLLMMPYHLLPENLTFMEKCGLAVTGIVGMLVLVRTVIGILRTVRTVIRLARPFVNPTPADPNQPLPFHDPEIDFAYRSGSSFGPNSFLHFPSVPGYVGWKRYYGWLASRSLRLLRGLNIPGVVVVDSIVLDCFHVNTTLETDPDTPKVGDLRIVSKRSCEIRAPSVVCEYVIMTIDRPYPMFKRYDAGLLAEFCSAYDPQSDHDRDRMFSLACVLVT
jgi:uncharacterized membrane protein